MPSFACAGGCPKLISISAVPGGNPVAKADPEHWAMEYGKCATCNAHYCTDCLTRAGTKNCTKDNTALTMLGPVPLASAAPAAPPSQPTATSNKPWWKFWG